MNHSHSIVLTNLLLIAFLFMSLQLAFAQNQAAGPAAPQHAGVAGKTYDTNLVEQGGYLFGQDCGFCHGRDAGGGETRPDLAHSTLVGQDVNGDKIGLVVTNGHPEAGRPLFDISEQQVAELVAFIHTQQKNAITRKGERKGVDAVDLQTGNVAAGRKFKVDAPVNVQWGPFQQVHRRRYSQFDGELTDVAMSLDSPHSCQRAKPISTTNREGRGFGSQNEL